MKRTIVGISLLLLGAMSIQAQEWFTDIEAAQSEATKESRPILLIFQGSDWCAPCIKMERGIWNSEAFTAYAQEHLVLLKADFPRKKKNRLSSEQQEKNNLLAEKYNHEGYFPFVALLDKEGTVLAETGYQGRSPKDFIETFLQPHSSPTEQSFQRSAKLMGNHFEVTVVAKDSVQASLYINMAIEEIERIEQLISSWDQNSQTSRINRNAGIEPVVVDNELFSLIERSLSISKLTDGGFDISFASMDALWKFDGSMLEMPSDKEIKQAASKIGYQNIVLDKQQQTVFLQQEGMKIGFGSIGKGYAADRVKALLMAEGVSAGIINASGDMNTWGKQPNGEHWKVGIANPLNKNKVFATLPVKNKAVVTSGDYEKYVEFNGQRYSHIIDPRTGYPATGVVSVTVFAPKAELADAVATSIFVVGTDVGLHLVDQVPQVECIIVDSDGNIHESSNITIEHEN